ncbi:hypothetical protein HA402_001615 [Bradysia odoriphaga]|nr:hypothetical protein HA402_001615 [Bradysia odoriphaga]
MFLKVWLSNVISCDSDTKDGCANMTDRSIIAEECDDAKQIELQEQFENRNRNFLLRISDIYYHRSPNREANSVPMVCQKLVGTDEYQTRSVVRRCQLANVECDYSYCTIGFTIL